MDKGSVDLEKLVLELSSSHKSCIHESQGDSFSKRSDMGESSLWRGPARLESNLASCSKLRYAHDEMRSLTVITVLSSAEASLPMPHCLRPTSAKKPAIRQTD